MTTLQDRLHEALGDMPGATQADLARAAGVRPPSVSLWFSGATRALRGQSLMRAAAFLRVEPLWLAEGRGPKRAAAGRQAEPPAGRPADQAETLAGFADQLARATPERREAVLALLRDYCAHPAPETLQHVAAILRFPAPTQRPSSNRRRAA